MGDELASGTVSELIAGLQAGDRRSLARAITLAESTRPEHREQADAILSSVIDRSGTSIRVGITGTPGVGKSTFIDSLGTLVIDEPKRRLAVLAVDPSSTMGRGSILGDKTRMATLGANREVFIRPSPSGGISGGVTARTRDAIALCEAAGYNTIFVETVGVGQSEVAVANLTDLFLLLLAPGGGDDLQGIKRGVMELADLVAVNKADGDQQARAGRTADDYRSALHLIRPRRPGFSAEVLTCSAMTGDGLESLWEAITSWHDRLETGGHLATLRASQAIAQLDDEVRRLVLSTAEQDPAYLVLRAELQTAVSGFEVPATVAAKRLALAALNHRSAG